MLPAALLLGGWLGYPLVVTFTRGIGGVGRVLSDPEFARVALQTAAFAFVSVPLELLLGLGFAVLLHRLAPGRGSAAARASVLLPWTLPTAVMAMAWAWIFNDQYGIANEVLVRLGALDAGLPWLGRPGTAFAALVFADLWKTTPFVVIVLLAGLQGIPAELHEALAVDGAGPVRRFFWITLPLLRPSLAVAVTFRLIHALGIFDLVWVLTGGGPAGSTRTLTLYIYDQVFRYLRPDDAAAATLVSVLLVFAVSAGTGALIRGRARP